MDAFRTLRPDIGAAVRTALSYSTVRGMQLVRGDLVLLDPAAGDSSLAEVWFHLELEDFWTVAVLHPLERGGSTFGQYRLSDSHPAP